MDPDSVKISSPVRLAGLRGLEVSDVELINCKISKSAGYKIIIVYLRKRLDFKLCFLVLGTVGGGLKIVQV